MRMFRNRIHSVVIRLLIVFLITFFVQCMYAQENHTIIVFFLYGSQPKSEFKNEPTYLGGIYGGHVSIGIDSLVVGFSTSLTSKRQVHIFPHKHNSIGKFFAKDIRDFLKDTVSRKYTTIAIPLSEEQYDTIKQIHNDYLQNSPYDYAFFGMRCAASAYEILSQAGIVKSKSKCGVVFSNFYPKLLRYKLFHLAKANGYKVTKHKGNKRRNWEKD